jgi:4-amino-4-deoxy-L-arabinose transferase-like glycosyltransferase
MAVPYDPPVDRRWLVAGALILILAGATFARFADLQTNPGGLYPDEAAEALSGRQIARDAGYRPLFIPENGGREALFAYTVAAGFIVAGDNVDTLRGVAALWGVLGALAIWLLARRFGTGAGLTGAAWAAGSLWLIAISRDGMRNTIVPFFGAIALLALITWADRPSRRRAIIAGAVVALASLYTYQPLKLLPLLAFLWLLWMRRGDRARFTAIRPTLGPAVDAFAVVALPMVIAALQNPQAWLGRAIGVTPFNPGLTGQEDVIPHTLRTLGMFTTFGDPNARHDVAGLPLLGWPLAIVGLIGVRAAWRYRGHAEFALVLLSLPLMLIPGLIAIEGGSPHFLRALGLAAPLGVLVGLGAQWIADRIRVATSRLVAGAAVAAFFLALGVASTWNYLSRPAADRFAPFSSDLVAIAADARPSDVVVLDDFSALTVEYLSDSHVTIVKPGTSIDTTHVHRVIARSLEDLRSVLGSYVAVSALVDATDPAGQPAVWVSELP